MQDAKFTMCTVQLGSDAVCTVVTGRAWPARLLLPNILLSRRVPPSSSFIVRMRRGMVVMRMVMTMRMEMTMMMMMMVRRWMV